MAAVTGLTAARMLAIEASSVVSGTINGSGHLILTKHDGSTIDAGNALVAVPSEDLVHFLDPTSYTNDTPPTSYPDGVSLMYISAAEATTDWTTFSGKWGSVRTINYTSAYSDGDTVQTWTRLHGSGTTPEMWMRAGNASTGWSSWIRLVTTGDLLTSIASTIPAESALPSAYALGVTLFSVNAGSGWTPNGGVGTIVTVRLSDNRIFQNFYSNFGGTLAPQGWFRTSDGGGWTTWAKLATPNDPSTMGITGEIKMWSSSTIPNGWSLCDGGTLDRTLNSALFAVIGITYGAGDGTTTFNKPDMKGRVPVGFNSGDTNFNAMGKTGGEATHVLTQAEMPSHTHTQNPHTHGYSSGTGAITDASTGNMSYGIQNGSFYGFYSNNPNNTTAVNQNTGGGGAHNNLQPYITIRYIIKL